MSVVKNLLIRLLGNNDDAKKKLRETETQIAKIRGKSAVGSFGDKLSGELEKAQRGARSVNDETKKAPGSFFGRLTGQVNEARKSMSGAKAAFEGTPLGTLFAPAAAAMAIFTVAVNAASAAWDAWMDKQREGGEWANARVAEMSKYRQAAEERRQTDAAAMEQLQKFRSVEKLGDAQREESIRLVRQLNRNYGDLGLTIDEATGKVSGLDGAWKQMFASDDANRLSEFRREIKDTQTELAEYRRQLDLLGKQGKNVKSNPEFVAIGDKVKAAEARLVDLRNSEEKLRLSEGAADRTRRRKVEDEIKAAVAMAEAAKLRGEGRTEEASRKEFDVRMSSRGDLTLWEKDQLWEMEQQRKKFEEEAKKTEEAKAKAKQKQEDQWTQRAQKFQDRADFISDDIQASRYEIELQRLKNAGLDDEIDRLQIRYELKRRGMEVDEDLVNMAAVMRKERRQVQQTAQNTGGETRRDFDSMRRLGLYNWSAGALVNTSLDQKRNSLLGEIRDGVKKWDNQPKGGTLG